MGGRHCAVKACAVIEWKTLRLPIFFFFDTRFVLLDGHGTVEGDWVSRVCFYVCFFSSHS